MPNPQLKIVKTTHAIARPLKVLVPLIQTELGDATEAGLEHYRRAGEMLIEAKNQVAYGSWGRWLRKNFALSDKQARRYMQLARKPEPYTDPASVARDRSITETIGEKRHKPHATLKHLFKETAKVDVARLAAERQKLADEIALHRELAIELIDLGYRAMATRLHPDRGGSQEAMTRLNDVRDQLKSIAAVRRFV
jgi:hypothetical protein